MCRTIRLWPTLSFTGKCFFGYLSWPVILSMEPAALLCFLSIGWNESLPHAQYKVISFVCSREIAAIWNLSQWGLPNSLFFSNNIPSPWCFASSVETSLAGNMSVPERVFGCGCAPRPPGGADRRWRRLFLILLQRCGANVTSVVRVELFLYETLNTKPQGGPTWTIGGILTHSLFFTRA